MTLLYKPLGKIWHNDGREQALFETIHNHPNHALLKSNPERIFSAIDQYAHEQCFLMNVGQAKGRIVTDLISALKPKIMVEVGGYVGYSAIMFGNAFKKAGGQKYFSLEVSGLFASVSTALIELAGLSDVVEVVVGPCRDSLRAMARIYGDEGLGVIFIDHAKHEYTNDLKLCEELGLVGRGTTVVADNILFPPPGNSEYMGYVGASAEEKEKRVAHLDEEGGNGDRSRGNPRLVYESSVVHSFEPSGEPDALEISRCLGPK